MSMTQAKIEYEKGKEIDATLRGVLEADRVKVPRFFKNYVEADATKPFRLYVERIYHNKIQFVEGDAWAMSGKTKEKEVRDYHDKIGCIFTQFSEQARYNKSVQAKVDNLRDEIDVLEGVLSDEEALLRVFALKGNANGVSVMKVASAASQRAINENKEKITKLLMGGQI